MRHGGLVDTIQNCEAVCENMSTYLKGIRDATIRQRQARLVRDCADICGLTAKMIARDSYFARQTAGLCAFICEMCAKECMQFPDRMSQNCAEVCMHCARECRQFAMM